MTSSDSVEFELRRSEIMKTQRPSEKKKLYFWEYQIYLKEINDYTEREIGKNGES